MTEPEADPGILLARLAERGPKRCPAGHLYNERNTYVYIDGAGQYHRHCRECNRQTKTRVRHPDGNFPGRRMRGRARRTK